MTLEQIRRAKALAQCTFLPGSAEKRFVRDMERKAIYDMQSALTPRQASYLELLCYKFRRQLKLKGFDDLVPGKKPELGFGEVDRRPDPT